MIKEILNFEKMITPSIIKFVFWIGSIFTILAGLIGIISGLTNDYGGGMDVFSGLILMVVGPLGVRIYCELLIIFFKIHETLNVLKKQNQQKIS